VSLVLTADVARRMGAVAEGFMSPLRWPTVDAWMSDTERRVRALFPGSNVLISPVNRDVGMRHYSDSVDAGTRRMLNSFHERDPKTGRLLSRDHPLQLWYDYRQANRISVWGEPVNAQHLVDLGTSIGQCAWYVDGLLPARLRDFAGMTSDLGDDALFFCIGYDRKGASRLGFDAEFALLEALLPAFRAGHHALATLGARQAALGATLDAIPDALLVLNAEGRELHRNAALRRALAADPDRDRLLAAMREAAAALGALRRGPDARGPASLLSLVSPAARAAAAERAIATAGGRYAVRAAYGSEHVWGTPGTVLVSLETQAAPRGAEAPAATAALTARERQVYDLLARRMTDDEVAAALGISWHTARRHTERVLAKVGVRSRRELGQRDSRVDSRQ
jgi:DNA-binding CsgD family transcriptional regulator/PAS domain-containing protein